MPKGTYPSLCGKCSQRSQFFPPGVIWQCLETLWAVTLERCYWQLVSIGQSQDSAPNPQQRIVEAKLLTVPQLRNPPLCLYYRAAELWMYLLQIWRRGWSKRHSFSKTYMTQSLLTLSGLPGVEAVAYIGAQMIQLCFHLTELWTSFWLVFVCS